MVYDVGAPLVAAVQVRVAVVSPGRTARLVGPAGTDALAGVTVSSSTRDTPWSLTASRLTEFTPAFRCACRNESW